MLNSTVMGYELLDHTSDLRVRVSGKSLSDIFVCAATAAMDSITDRSKVAPRGRVEIAALGETYEELLVHWLEEILYLVETKGMVFREFGVNEIRNNGVLGWAKGEAVEPDRHELYSEIKAVTFHNLKIEASNAGYTVEIVFDI